MGIGECRQSAYVRYVSVVLQLLFFGTVFAAEESKLSREPIPLQTEAYALFAVQDITDFNGLAARLIAGADDPETPAGRVWSLLSPVFRETLKRLDEGDSLERSETYAMINELNAVIRRRDLYVTDIWDCTSLPDDLREELEAGPGDLPPIEITARNRRLLKATFPDFILESQVKPFPDRPAPLRLFGDPFLDRGNLQRGIKLPTGAVWQPSLFVYGTFRSAWQYVDTGTRPPPIEVNTGPPILRDVFEIEEWANRLDLFANLELTATERIVLGLRPIDEGGDFGGYEWQRPDLDEARGFHLEGDLHIEQFYFEGDFGELFPNLDPDDRHDFDIGFAIGRQPLFIQDGIMINDNLDGLGITKNNIQLPWASNMRVTAFYAWENIHRGVGPLANRRQDDAELYGLFTSIDTHRHTFNLDIAYTKQDSYAELLPDDTIIEFGGDQLNIGFNAIQRIGKINTTLSVNASFSTGGDGDSLQSGDGQVVLLETSYTPAYSENLIYANAFWANDNFQSAARDPATGGPLARTGILFEAPGLGRFTSAIPNTAGESAGGAIGYQHLFNHGRQQLILEAGGRSDTDGRDIDEFGGVLRYQHAFSNRYVLRADAFYVARSGRDNRRGLRTEFLVRF